MRFLHVFPAVIGLRTENSVVSPGLVECGTEERRGNKLDVFAILAADTDQLAGEVSPAGEEVGPDNSKMDRNLGKVLLTTLLRETSTNPNDYHIDHVEQYLSRDKTVRQYRYEFCDFTRRVTVDGLARRLREASVIEELSQAVGFPFLRVTDLEWDNGQKYNYFKSSYHNHKEYQEWTDGVRRIFLLVENGNDAAFGKLSRPQDFTDDQTERRFEKALLIALLSGEEGASEDPDDYIVNHVAMCSTKDGKFREYQIDFFDTTQKLARATVVNCVRREGTLAKLNKALDLKFLHVGDWSHCGELERFKNTMDVGFWKLR